MPGKAVVPQAGLSQQSEPIAARAVGLPALAMAGSSWTVLAVASTGHRWQRCNSASACALRGVARSREECANGRFRRSLQIGRAHGPGGMHHRAGSGRDRGPGANRACGGRHGRGGECHARRAPDALRSGEGGSASGSGSGRKTFRHPDQAFTKELARIFAAIRFAGLRSSSPGDLDLFAGYRRSRRRRAVDRD